MSDYVSRQYLLDEYDRQHQGPPGGARKIIEEAPACDVVQVVHGEWIEIKNHNNTTIALRCNKCGQSPKHAIRSRFCPHCGVKMDGKREE